MFGFGYFTRHLFPTYTHTYTHTYTYNCFFFKKEAIVDSNTIFVNELIDCCLTWNEYVNIKTNMTDAKSIISETSSVEHPGVNIFDDTDDFELQQRLEKFE